MALRFSPSPAYHISADGHDTIHAALFDEGHLAQTEVAGILKSSSHQELAKQFLAYLASAEGQKVIPTTNWMLPVVELGADLDPAFATLPQPAKTLVLSDEAIAANSQRWIDEMLAAVR
jgi:thiamine transport system substrate-binding protein